MKENYQLKYNTMNVFISTVPKVCLQVSQSRAKYSWFQALTVSGSDGCLFFTSLH